MIRTGASVTVLRDIPRNDGPEPYARRGEAGVVVDLFRPPGTGAGERKPLYAKVQMEGGEIKTFRLTSIAASGEGKP